MLARVRALILGNNCTFHITIIPNIVRPVDVKLRFIFNGTVYLWKWFMNYKTCITHFHRCLECTVFCLREIWLGTMHCNTDNIYRPTHMWNIERYFLTCGIAFKKLNPKLRWVRRSRQLSSSLIRLNSLKLRSNSWRFGNNFCRRKWLNPSYK